MINERKLTEKELEKREVALKGLLKNKQSLVKKYGKNAEKVMYGIATKQAKSKVEAMNLDKIKETIEGLDIGSKVKIAKEYGGGKGTVEDIKGSFVVVKTKKGNESYHESDLKPVEERIKELIVKSLTKEDNDPSGEYLEGDPDEKVEENISEDKKFSIDETKLIARNVGAAVALGLKELGDTVSTMKVKDIKPNSFEIFVEYDNDSEDQFSFYIDEDDTLHLADFSFDKEMGDVGIDASEKVLLNVDAISKELVKHWRSMNEDLDIGHEDNEPQMLKAELARAGQMVQMLYKAIDKYDGQGEVDFPQWWQKKIIQANAMLDSAFDYIDGKEKVAQIDAVIDMVDEVTTDKEFEASEEEARLEKHPEKDLINKIKAMMSQEKVKEILTKKSSVDKHIEDFKDSDAPQFKGKSDKKKIQMAVASFLAKQNK